MRSGHFLRVDNHGRPDRIGLMRDNRTRLGLSGRGLRRVELPAVGAHRLGLRECVVQHHYLACPTPYGGQLRYRVRHQGRALDCLLCDLADLAHEGA